MPVTLIPVSEDEARRGAIPAYTPSFDTILNSDQESAFRQWKARYAPNDSGADYDLRGAFRAGVTPDPKSGHWPDTFKKPNHPTFSDESIYASVAPERAGHWNGDQFVAPGQPLRLMPVDPLEDFDAYNAIEDEKEARGYDPADPGIAGHIWRGVSSLVAEIPSAIKGAATIARGAGVLGSLPIVGERYRDEAKALAAETAGKILGNYNVLGQGAKTLFLKASAKMGEAMTADPELEARFKQDARRASWEFLREARDTEQFTNDFNQHLEVLFPRALQGLGAVPVDDKAAGALSMVADPANFIPAGAAARWTMQAPLRGAVRAAETAVKEAALDVAKASASREVLTSMLKPGIAAAEEQLLKGKISSAAKALELAQTRKAEAVQALTDTAAKQRAIVDQLATEAASQSLAQRTAAAGAQMAGRAAGAAGNALQMAGRIPEAVANRIAASADDSARQSIAEGVRNVAGGFGLVPAAAGGSGVLLSGAGRNLQAFGRLLAEAESQLPFFKQLARETTGLTKWTASLVDQSGLGQVVAPVARAAGDATRGLPMAAAAGYIGSGGDTGAAAEAAGGGMVFGLAGGAYGQWQRYWNGGLFRQRQLADINRYRATIPTDEARTHFDKMPGADRAALATMQLAHPDLKIRHEKLGPGKASFYYVAEDGPVAVINLDSQDGVAAIVAHEVGHHVERHGLGPDIERVLFGDPLTETPGLFTQLDESGKPVIDLDGSYARNGIWQRVKTSYNDRLKASAARTGEVIAMRDDAAMAKEVFAEHVADYLLGRDGALVDDLQSNVLTRALGAIGDSSLGASVPALRQILGKAGVPLDARRRVTGSELFPGGLPASRYLRQMIREYHRRSSSGNVPAIDADERGGTRYTADELAKYPQILDQLFDGSDDVARDRRGRVQRDKAGSPVFLDTKQQKAQRAALAQEIGDWLEQNPPGKDAAGADIGRPAAARLERATPAKSGRAEEGWLTPALPDTLLDRLEQSGKYNPVQIAHLRLASRAIAEGKGGSALFFYQPAIGPKGRYKGLAGDWRTETPYGIFVSKAGNVLLRTVSREKLMANAQALVQGGKASLWNNNLPELVRDIDVYLANHAAGKPGSETIGTAKRDQINALFGINTKTNAAANPLLESSPRVPVVIRSRRLDRINRMTPVDVQFPTTYDLLNRNFRPEPPGGGGGPQPVSWSEVKPGMRFDAVKKLMPKAEDYVPGFAAKGPEAAVLLRIKGWLEMNPIATDADGRRILLAAPERMGGSDPLTNRAKHLAGEKEPGMGDNRPRIFRPDRAKLVAAIPRTLGDYHAKLRDRRNGNHLYLRRYADGTLHLVVVEPTAKRVVDHGEVAGSLTTQYQPASTTQFADHELLAVRESRKASPPEP